MSVITRKVEAKPVVNVRHGGRGYGLASTNEYCITHVSSTAPLVSLTSLANGNGGAQGSDMHISSGSDDEFHGMQHSIESSPQDDKVPISADPAYGTAAQSTKERSRNDCAKLCSTGVLSDSGTSIDISCRSYRSNNGDETHRAPCLSDDQTSDFSNVDAEAMTTQMRTNRRNVRDTKASLGSTGARVNPRNFMASSDSGGTGAQTEAPASSLSPHPPNFYASEQGPWYSMIAYEACVRLCLQAWAKSCVEEVFYFLNNECALLREAFSLQHVLLQSEEELLAKEPSESVSKTAAQKSKKPVGRIKVQVRRIKMSLEPGCSISSLNIPMLNLESVRQRVSDLNSTLSSGWEAVRKVRVSPHASSNGSLSGQSLGYLHASTQYLQQVSKVLKTELKTLQKSSQSHEQVQETYSCMLRLKSSPEEDYVQMQPGCSENHVFLPDGLGDDLIVELKNSKGQYCGRVLVQVVTIADNPGDNKLRWWPIYHEPEHELVGRIQLFINYCQDENSQTKCGSVAETVAYDLVLEVAMKFQKVQQRNLLLKGPWKWLVTEFSSYYGVSDAYTKLRYLSYVMDVATPTKDCLDVIYDLLLPVLMKGKPKSVLSHQENRILGEVTERAHEVLALVFENYKSLDETLPSGLMDVFGPATGVPAPALISGVKLYSLLNDILCPETQLRLCRYLQAAGKKRARRHMVETNDFVVNKNEIMSAKHSAFASSYQKMRSLILNLRNEVRTDIEIHEQHVLPSFIDLPNLSAPIYSVELCRRLREFLVACHPPSPSAPVVELVITTADFQRDLTSWNISPIKGGVDARELFHPYISHWIGEKRIALLDLCKLDKESFEITGSTTSFVDDMYDRLKKMLDEYEIIIRRWPDYATALEKVIADIERAMIDSLEKQFVEVLHPLKDTLGPKILGLKYVQKLAKGTINAYSVPEELGVLLNSMRRMLDVLRPNIETQMRTWFSYVPDNESGALGDRMSEVTVLLRARFRSYVQAVVEKLAENTKMQNGTRLKKIIQELKDTVIESDAQSRMQPLKELLVKAIHNLHSVFVPHVFIAVCRAFWDRMGQDVLRLLESSREMSWCKGPRVAISILDGIFVSEMQRLLGNALQDEDLEPPRSMMEVRSMLCKDAMNYGESCYY